MEQTVTFEDILSFEKRCNAFINDEDVRLGMQYNWKDLTEQTYVINVEKSVVLRALDDVLMDNIADKGTSCYRLKLYNKYFDSNMDVFVATSDVDDKTVIKIYV